VSIIRTRCASFRVHVIHEEMTIAKTLLERSLCGTLLSSVAFCASLHSTPELCDQRPMRGFRSA
jgi:hypothetical protein